MPLPSGIRAGRAFVELFADDSRLVRGLRAAERKLKAFGSQVRRMGAQMTAASAAAITPLALSARTFAGFEQEMARVRALTGAGGKDFDRLSETAKRLGEQTVFSASQAAQAMSFFALAGFKVDEILNAIGPTLNLAAAGQLEIAQSADIAAKIMAGMGLSADELGRAVDVLTKAMTTANTDLGQLGDAMKFVGPIAKSAGQSFEETVAAIQLLSNAGVQGEMAGTTLRGVLLSLTSPSVEASEQLRRLGVRVLDAQGNVRSLANIIDDVNRGLEGLGGGQRLEVVGKIFDARQAAGFAELLAQGGDRLREFTEALGDSAGTADRIAAIQLDTLKGDLTILTSALEGLRIAVGESLGNLLRNAVQNISRLIASTAQWVRDNRQLVVTIAKVVAAAFAGGIALVALGTLIAGFGSAIGVLISAVTGVVAVFKLMGAALAFLVSPIGLVIAAVVALATAILHATGMGGRALAWLGDRFEQLRGVAVSAFRGIGDALVAGDIALAARVLWLALKLAWQQGIDALHGLWVQFKTGFLKVAAEAWFGALATLQTAIHAIEVAWIETTSFLSTTWSGFTAGFSKAWGSAVNWVTKRLLELMGLFDESFDVETAKRLADRDLATNNREADQRRDAEIAARESLRQRERDDAHELHEATLAQIGEQANARLQTIDDEAQQRRALTENELLEAKRAFEEALEEARRKRAAVDVETNDLDEADSVASKIRSALSNLGDIGDLIGNQADKIGVRGTFNAAAIAGLASGGRTEERIAKAAEETARNTRRIEQAIQDGNLAFG